MTENSPDLDAGFKKRVKTLKWIEHTNLESWILRIRLHEKVACDIETTGFNHLSDRILYLGAHGDMDDDTYHVISGENIQKSLHCIEELQGGLADLDFFKEIGLLIDEEKWPKFIWQNGKFDQKFLRRVGLDLPVDIDTMLMTYVLNEQQGNHDLDSIALHYCGLQPHKDMVSYYYRGGRTLADAPKELVLDYLGRDLRSTKMVEAEMRPLIDRDTHNSYLEKRLIRGSNLLSAVESTGIMVDWKRVDDNFTCLQQSIDDRTHNLLTLSGGYVENPNSTQQVQHYLYEIANLPPIAESSNSETLNRLLEMRGDNEFINEMLLYRKEQKLFGTYVKNVRGLAVGDRIYPTFKLHGTITGRLASQDPNMQNVPRENLIRNQFRAPPGKRLMGIDLNQAELRALACLSEDPLLIGVYNDPTGISLHDRVAEWLFGEEWAITPDVKRENKIRAKAVNFGIVYGRTGSDIAREYRLAESEGEAWLKWWFTMFPEVHKFLQRCREAPEKEESIVSPFGNRKRPKVITGRTKHNVQNQASNFLPQNIASNLILDASAILFERHQKNWSTEHKGWQIVNLIHDESLFEVVNDPCIQQELFDEFSTIVKDIAHAHDLTAVPFVCEAKLGTHWGSMEEQK